MAIISETELQRRLRELEKKSSGSRVVVKDYDPESNGTTGDTWYNSSTSNLWVFNGTNWEPSFNYLNIRYADSVTNRDENNKVSSQTDVVGFSEYPFSVDGVQKTWRGIFFGPASGSSDPTDYEWTLLADTEYDLEFERYYTEFPGILTELGDPDNPATGVTWVEATSGLGSNTYWVAERYTQDGSTSGWVIFPVQPKPNGIPFVKYTITGRNAPSLGSAQWISDAIAAVSSFSGKIYTNQKEFGIGTVVVIDYDDTTLSGKYTQVGGVDTWTPPGQIIQGDLFVDGTIAGDKIQANTIQGTNIAAGAITADKIDVTDLSSITADIGTITAGVLKSSDNKFIIDLTNKTISITV
jgi:hypothetical protein